MLSILTPDFFFFLTGSKKSVKFQILFTFNLHHVHHLHTPTPIATYTPHTYTVRLKPVWAITQTLREHTHVCLCNTHGRRKHGSDPLLTMCNALSVQFSHTWMSHFTADDEWSSIFHTNFKMLYKIFSKCAFF